MLIYPDSKDLINLLERSVPCGTEQFEDFLRSNGHQIALSFCTVVEVAAPLLERRARTNVMTVLGKLETMPIRYVHEAKIPLLELSEARDSFSLSREYLQVNPFVGRFDGVISVTGLAPTRCFLKYRLAETVFDLWRYNPRIFCRYKELAAKMRNSVINDRNIQNPPSPTANFTKKVALDFQLDRLPLPAAGFEALASWIYNSPSRCPGIRVAYETYHRLVRNSTDIPKDSDLVDILRLYSLPYVDAMTVDRRILNYVKQARGLNLSPKLFSDLKAIMECRHAEHRN